MYKQLFYIQQKKCNESVCIGITVVGIINTVVWKSDHFRKGHKIKGDFTRTLTE